jgi:hypothetical protein
MEKVDLDAARKAVSVWLDEHPDGSLGQMADDLKVHYPDHQDDMAVVLRGLMVTELRHRTSPSPEGSQLTPQQSGRCGEQARNGGPR